MDEMRVNNIWERTALNYRLITSFRVTLAFRKYTPHVSTYCGKGHGAETQTEMSIVSFPSSNFIFPSTPLELCDDSLH